VGAVDPADCPDPWLALDALDRVPFLVSLELRRSPVTDRADVVLPVAAAVEKAGTFLDWEGRARPFDAVLHRLGGLSDSRVLHVLADELDRPLGPARRRVGARRDRPARRRDVPAGLAAAGRPRPDARGRRGAARLLALAARRRLAAGRRAVPRRHRQAPAAAPVRRHRGRDRRDAGRPGHREQRAGQPDPAAGRRRPAGPGGLGADAHPDAAVRRDLAVLPGAVVRLSLAGAA
jgi:NADH-quinone oxidoreductase subunit G